MAGNKDGVLLAILPLDLHKKVLREAKKFGGTDAYITSILRAVLEGELPATPCEFDQDITSATAEQLENLRVDIAEMKAQFAEQMSLANAAQVELLGAVSRIRKSQLKVENVLAKTQGSGTE